MLPLCKVNSLLCYLSSVCSSEPSLHPSVYLYHILYHSGELDEEVLRLTSENATLQGRLSEKDSSRETIAALQKQNNSIMKQLEVDNSRLEEMQLDADDMRQSYRLQLDQLAQENERLRHQQS